MTAGLSLADGALAAAEGSRRGRMIVRRLRDGMQLGPDDLVHELLELLAEDGQGVTITPRVRAFLREVSKALEASNR